MSSSAPLHNYRILHYLITSHLTKHSIVSTTETTKEKESQSEEVEEEEEDRPTEKTMVDSEAKGCDIFQRSAIWRTSPISSTHPPALPHQSLFTYTKHKRQNNLKMTHCVPAPPTTTTRKKIELFLLTVH